MRMRSPKAVLAVVLISAALLCATLFLLYRDAIRAPRDFAWLAVYSTGVLAWAVVGAKLARPLQRWSLPAKGAAAVAAFLLLAILSVSVRRHVNDELPRTFFSGPHLFPLLFPLLPALFGFAPRDEQSADASEPGSRC